MSLLHRVWAWLVTKLQGSFMSGNGGDQVFESLFDHKSPKIPAVTGPWSKKILPAYFLEELVEKLVK